MKTLKEWMDSNAVSRNKIDNKEKSQLVLEKSDNEDDAEVMFLLCLYLVSMSENETKRLWEKFENEIKYKNRFFPESDLLKIVKDISGYATVCLPENTILYRARRFGNDEWKENALLIALYEEINKRCPDLGMEKDDLLDQSTVNSMLAMLCVREGDFNSIIEKIEEKSKLITPFWGFDKKESDAPLNKYTKEGRANPKGISYLYAAQDEKTAIMEINPKYGQQYSVCKIKIIKDVKIFDFIYFPEKMPESKYTPFINLHAISEKFSETNTGDLNDYLPT